MTSTLTSENIDLLMKDLSGRLPYGVIVQNISDGMDYIKGDLLSISRYEPFSVYVMTDHASGDQEFSPVEHIRPYLRPMKSMTVEEESELLTRCFVPNDARELRDKMRVLKINLAAYDFLNSHHFDYRGLIKKGLAIEAPEGMYEVRGSKPWVYDDESKNPFNVFD